MVKAMGPVYQGKRQPTMFAAADNKTHASIRRPVAPAYAMSKIIQVRITICYLSSLVSPKRWVLSEIVLAAQFEPFVDKNTRLFYRKLDQLFISTGKPCDYHNWVQYCKFQASSEASSLMQS